MWVAHCSSVLFLLLFSSLTDLLFPLLRFGVYVGCTFFLFCYFVVVVVVIFVIFFFFLFFLFFSSLTDLLFPLQGFGLYVGCTLFLCFVFCCYFLPLPIFSFGLCVGCTMCCCCCCYFLPLPIFSLSTPGRTPQHVRFPVDSHSCAAAVIARWQEKMDFIWTCAICTPLSVLANVSESVSHLPRLAVFLFDKCVGTMLI